MGKSRDNEKNKYIIGDLVFSGDFAEAILEKPILEAMRISSYIDKDCPAFSKFHSEVILKVSEFIDEGLGGQIDDEFLDHPIHQLRQYSFALQDACWQTLYSITRFNRLADWKANALGETSRIDSYITFYFSSFLARTKTVTDILALLINHTFELGIEFNKCGLDKGFIANRLNNVFSNETSNRPNQYVKKLSRELERSRQNWIEDFYEIRNIVTHRGEYWGDSFSVRFAEGSFEHLFTIGPSPHTPQLAKLVSNIAHSSMIVEDHVSDISLCVFDPIIFCNEIWVKLALLINYVSDGCYHHIGEFIAKNNQPSERSSL